MLYSVGFVYGRVAIIILLFYLTPVWSTLIGRLLFGWRSTPARLAAILFGLIGLAVMLGANGDWPLPRNVGEWLALAAGVLWSIASTGIRVKADLDVLENAEPIYTEFAGWNQSTMGTRSFDQLPDNAKRYIDGLQTMLGAGFLMISTGPERKETIRQGTLF